jgi:uncharacterized membrane protein YfbV (UPF0208 family)
MALLPRLGFRTLFAALGVALPLVSGLAQVPRTVDPRQLCVDGVFEVDHAMVEITDQAEYRKVADLLKKMEQALTGARYDECASLLKQARETLDRY